MTLTGEVEMDEVYVVAGHKGNPAAVARQGRKGRRRRLKGARGRGTLAKEKPPIFGMLQRGGEVVIHMLANVQQKTIAPLIKRTVVAGSQIYTDEYNIYHRLSAWGYPHKTVNHSQGEYARDDDGDGFCEVHVNSMEGFGPCCALGCAHIAASPKKNYRFTSVSSNSFTMCADAARLCCLLCSLFS